MSCNLELREYYFRETGGHVQCRCPISSGAVFAHTSFISV
jgi:hypothetical protein